MTLISALTSLATGAIIAAVVWHFAYRAGVKAGRQAMAQRLERRATAALIGLLPASLAHMIIRRALHEEAAR